MMLSWALGPCYIDREKPPMWHLQDGLLQQSPSSPHVHRITQQPTARAQQT
jgi:hypothetical protein